MNRSDGRLESQERVPSPCVNICRMSTSRMDGEAPLCEGCLRTLDEIIRWGTADDDYRNEVWRRIFLRRE